MRITRVFLDISMVNGFQGLREIAKKAKTKMGPDTTVLFLNKATTSFKIIINDTYIVYFRNGHRKIPLDALRYLPTTFGGTEMEMKEAVKTSLIKKMGWEIS